MSKNLETAKSSNIRGMLIKLMQGWLARNGQHALVADVQKALEDAKQSRAIGLAALQPFSRR